MSTERPRLTFQGPDPDIAPTHQTCCEWHGIHVCPREQIAVSLEAPHVRLVLVAARGAIYADHTPAGARQLAEHLMRAADFLESWQKDQANAQLAAALAKRGQA